MILSFGLYSHKKECNLRTGSSGKSSRMKVEIVPITPTNRLMHIMTMYAVLGTSNMKEAGYIKGVMDQLERSIQYHIVTCE